MTFSTLYQPIFYANTRQAWYDINHCTEYLADVEYDVRGAATTLHI